MAHAPLNAPLKHKWQFSLRTMLIVLTLLAAMLAPMAYLGWFGLLPMGLLLAYVAVCYVITRISQASVLVQILCLGAIVVVLLALIVPGTSPAPIAAKRLACSNNLKQLALAMQLYHDEHGHFPPAYVADDSGLPLLSWRVLLLPYLEELRKFDAVRWNEPWNGPNNSQLAACPKYFQCPADSGVQPSSQMTSYVLVTGPGTAFPGDGTTNRDQFIDGTSRTILIVELANSGIHWMEPRDLSIQQMATTINPKSGQGISSDHGACAMAAFANGHVTYLPETLSAESVRALLTISGRDGIGEEY